MQKNKILPLLSDSELNELYKPIGVKMALRTCTRPVKTNVNIKGNYRLHAKVRLHFFKLFLLLKIVGITTKHVLGQVH